MTRMHATTKYYRHVNQFLNDNVISTHARAHLICTFSINSTAPSTWSLFAGQMTKYKSRIHEYRSIFLIMIAIVDIKTTCSFACACGIITSKTITSILHVFVAVNTDRGKPNRHTFVYNSYI